MSRKGIRKPASAGKSALHVERVKLPPDAAEIAAAKAAGRCPRVRNRVDVYMPTELLDAFRLLANGIVGLAGKPRA